MKKLNEKELKKVNGGTEGFELPPREYPEIDGRLIIKTDPEGGNRPSKGEGREIKA